MLIWHHNQIKQKKGVTLSDYTLFDNVLSCTVLYFTSSKIISIDYQINMKICCKYVANWK